MNERTAHADLLDQVERDKAIRDKVREILSPRVTEAEITRLNAQRLGDVERAVERWKQAPIAIGATNDAHRHSRPSCSRCDSGMAQCTTPEACQLAERDKPGPGDSRGDEHEDDDSQPMRPAAAWFLIAASLLLWALIAAGVIAAMGMLR